jgi:hypothetical protein
MTTLNAPPVLHRRRMPWILGGSLLVVLLVAGCAGPDPEPMTAAPSTATATTTPTAEAGEGELPQSEKEAIEDATDAAQTYIDIRTEIEVEHPADSSAIDGVAGGEVAADVHRIAEASLAAGTIKSGAYEFEVTTSFASDLTAPDGSVTPFGNVSLDGCFSTEGISATNADGSPAGMSSVRRGMLQMSVNYFAAEGKWIVMAMRPPETENVPC